jgi:hypothetical protein
MHVGRAKKNFCGVSAEAFEDNFVRIIYSWVQWFFQDKQIPLYGIVFIGIISYLQVLDSKKEVD